MKKLLLLLTLITFSFSSPIFCVDVIDGVEYLIAGNALVQGTLGVTGVATFNSSVIISTGLTLSVDAIISDDDLTFTPGGGDVLVNGGMTIGSTTEAGDNNLRVEGNATVVGTLDSPTINTGQGDVECYAMNQDMETTDNVIFNTVAASSAVIGTITSGVVKAQLSAPGLSLKDEEGDTIVVIGENNDNTVDVPSLNTGQGDNELYAMNQDVESTDSPEFAGMVITSGGTIDMDTIGATLEGAIEGSIDTLANLTSIGASTGIIKVTAGTISYLTDNTSNWDDAYTHVSSDGTDHTYINQDLRTTADVIHNKVTSTTGFSGTTLETTGDISVGGDLTINGNDIKDSGGSAAITFDGSQNVSVPNGDISTAGTLITTTANNSGSFDATAGTYHIWKHNGTSVGDVGIANQTITGGSSSDFGINCRTGSLNFGTGNTKRVEIDSSGNTSILTGYINQEGIFAEIYVADGSTSQTIPTGTTYEKITAFTTNGSSANCTAGAANDKITFTQTGRYLVHVILNGSVDIANTEFKAAVFWNGTIQNNIKAAVEFTAANKNGELALSGIVDVTSAPTDLDVRVVHDDGGGVDITIENANITVTYLGDT